MKTGENWAIAAIGANDGRDQCVARGGNGKLFRIDALPARISSTELFSAWETYTDSLRSWSPDPSHVIDDAPLLAPLRYPGKVVCVGANYLDHRVEMKTGEEMSSKPFFIMKPPRTTVIGPDEILTIRTEADRVDWEAEVGVVIGKKGRFIRVDDAMDHIAGYCLVNDVSARGVFARTDPIHTAFAFDWHASKSQDGFCPMGPTITPSWFVDDPDGIEFSLHVNGILQQQGNTAKLLHGIAQIIAALSELMTLEPGDLIATGTPGGVGEAKNRFLRNGDIVELSAPLLGSFSNKIEVMAEAPSQIGLRSAADG